VTATTPAPPPRRTSESRRATERVFPLLLACTAAGALLRFPTLHTQSYWYDEAVTVDLLHRSFGGMLSAISRSESTPPLYYVVAWAWSKAFGTGEVGLRSLSAVIGTLTVPVAYAAGRTFVSRRSSLAAAALVASSPFLVWYSQEARAYALLVLFAAASLACLRRHPATWAAAAGLALVTHYFALFLVAVEAAWLLRTSQAQRAVRYAVGAVGGIAILLTPLAISQAGYSKHTEWISHSGSVAGRTAYLLRQLVVGPYPTTHIRPLIVLVAVVAVVGVFTLTAVGDRPGAILALVLGVTAIAAPLVLAAVGDRLADGHGDYFIYRNVIAAVIPLSIAAGAVLQRAGVAAVVVTVVLLAAISFDVARRPDLQRPDVRGVAAAIGGPKAGQLIVADTRTATVLKLYLDVLEPPLDGRLTASAIDIVVDPEAVRPTDAPPGFRQAGIERVQGFTIVHLRALHPEDVRPRTVERRLRTAFEPATLVARQARAGAMRTPRRARRSAPA
jgi:mannosyltransferase